MGEREQIKSFQPVELQDKTLVAYARLPQFEPDKADTSLNTVAVSEERIRRIMSEQVDPLQKRFDELVEKSPATETFKEVLSELYHTIAIIGRESPLKESVILQQCLQLNTYSGIYEIDGAKEAEKILYNLVFDKFIDEFGQTIRVGEDMRERNWEKVFLMKYSLSETHELLLKWFGEATLLYGEPPWFD